MEAKDTMMLKSIDCAFQDGSYPCGYENGDKLPDCELCHKIRKAGIMEVVEWLQKHNIYLDHPYLKESQNWQAQMRKWGIEL